MLLNDFASAILKTYRLGRLLSSYSQEQPTNIQHSRTHNSSLKVNSNDNEYVFFPTDSQDGTYQFEEQLCFKKIPLQLWQGHGEMAKETR